jgi:hypothetical protein
MFEVDGLVAAALLLLWVYCIFDVIASDSAVVRNLPKTMWLFIVILLPDIGALAWLLLGRPERAGWRPGDTTQREQRWSGGPKEARPPDDKMLERDRLIAGWEKEEADRRQELRERVDRETQARKRAAEEQLIEARRRDREAEKLKAKALELPLPEDDDEAPRS